MHLPFWVLFLEVIYFLPCLFFFGYFACLFYLLVHLIVILGLLGSFPFSIMSMISVLIQVFFFSSQSLAIHGSLLYTFYIRPHGIHFILFIFFYSHLMFNAIKYSSTWYPLYPFHLLLLSPHVQDNQIYCVPQLRISPSSTHMSMSRLNCPMFFVFFFMLFD